MKKIVLMMVMAGMVWACSEQKPKDEAAATAKVQDEVSQQAETPKKSIEEILAEVKKDIPECKKGSLTITSAKDETVKFDYKIDIAKTPEQQELGLMFRKSIPEDYGMIFVWDEAKPVTFWMKNTFVALDMLFIGADNKVLSIKKEATPLSEAHISSNGDVIAVLEVLGGTVDRLGIAVGDTVTWTENSVDATVSAPETTKEMVSEEPENKE